MTKEEITERVEGIKIAKADYELAHQLEDQLYLDFVKYVSTLKTPIGDKAKELLKSREIDFYRVTA
jgi:hypothetical protein